MIDVLRVTVLVLVACSGLCISAPKLCAESIDESLYRTIHEDWQSPCIDGFMKGMSHLGDGESGIAICAALMTLGDEKASQTGKLSFVSIVGGSAITSGLKFIVNRDRPDSDSDSRFNSSFPSGHATGAFAVASVVGAKYKHLRIPMLLLASTVAISRVYLGRHYPSDVAGGAAIGLCAGWLVMKNEETILSLHF